MSSDPSLHDLASAYALDAIDGDERLVFEAHLEGCDRCRAEVASARETMAALEAVQPVEPPVTLRTDIMASIAETEQVAAVDGADVASAAAAPGSPSADWRPDAAIVPPAAADSALHAPVDLAARRERGLGRLLPVAAAVVVIAFGSFAVVRSGLLGDGTTDRPTVAEVAAADDARTVELDGAEGVDGSVAVVWSAELDVVSVKTSGLADPGPGRVYELWFVLEDGVAPAGLFTPEAGSFTGVLDVDELAAAGWGVTIEPEGGSDQPTGEILFVGQF